MDGIHDLGGKLGFGPVKVTHDDAPFHAPWEGRMMGIARSMRRPPDWNTDKFRHSRELEDPVAYLTRPYFDQWYRAYACMLVGADVVTIEELASGHSERSTPHGLPKPIGADEVHALAGTHRSDMPLEGTPRFRVGDAVRTLNISPTGHTRLPAYARARVGVVTAFHGGHLLPDAAAHNSTEVEPLYTVRFNLADLFPERAGSPDTVHLDLWESYLEPGA